GPVIGDHLVPPSLQEVHMYNQPPQWPDRPSQPPAGSTPNRRPTALLALIAVVAAVLIVTLFGTLFVVLSRGGLGTTQGGLEQSARSATAAAGGVSNNGQPLSDGGTPSSGGGAAQPTPTPAPTKTPTPPSAAPTATTHIICCLTILLPSVHQVVASATLS